MPRVLRFLLLWCLAGLWTQAWALEFRSVKAPGAVLYDGPSRSARKLHILSAGYPVEIVVSVEGWHKVRDATGTLAWVAVEQLSDERRVMIQVPRAAVRQAPEESAPILYEAEQGVLFRILETVPGWIRVEHRDGSTGFLRSAHAWGG